MMRKVILICIFGLFLAQPVWAGGKAMTLAECYQKALGHSETIAIASEEIALVKSQYNEILGAVMPKLSLTGTEILQERVNTGNSVESRFNRFSTPQAAVTLTQPIFHGFMDLYALKASKATAKEKEWLQREAERNLYLDVASIYYSIASIEKSIRTTSMIHATLSAQDKEMESWRKLGKVRESEYLAQKAEIALLEAELEKLKGQKKTAYHVMSYFTGLDPQPPIALQNPIKRLNKLEDYLSAVTSRPDVLAAKQDIYKKHQSVKMAKGDLMPALDLTADYYPYRTGINENVDWDVQFKLEIPVFNLTKMAKVKSAKTQWVQSNLKAQQMERNAVNEVKKIHATLSATIKQLGKYQNAASLAGRSYKLQREDYSKGLISHLELLHSERTWFDALKQRDATEVQSWLEWINLQRYAGIQP